MEQKNLEARVALAADWLRDGLISRAECFRLEVDASLGRDSGPVRWLRKEAANRSQSANRIKGKP